MRFKRVALGLAGLLFCGASDAAIQGNLGKRSDGSVHISVTKPFVAELKGIRDVEMSGSSLSTTQDICIFTSTGNYRVTALGNGTDNAFTMAGDGRALPYALSLATTGKYTRLTPNEALLVSSSPHGKNTGCRSARISVDIPRPAMEQAAIRHTSYDGILTVMIAPY